MYVSNTASNDAVQSRINKSLRRLCTTLAGTNMCCLLPLLCVLHDPPLDDSSVSQPLGYVREMGRQMRRLQPTVTAGTPERPNRETLIPGPPPCNNASITLQQKQYVFLAAFCTKLHTGHPAASCCGSRNKSTHIPTSGACGPYESARPRPPKDCLEYIYVQQYTRRRQGEELSLQMASGYSGTTNLEGLAIVTGTGWLTIFQVCVCVMSVREPRVVQQKTRYCTAVVREPGL